MIRCVHPEALLLLPFALLLLRNTLWPRPLLGCLRWSAVLLAALLLAEPSWPGEGDGRDIVLVVDRSRSMPDDTETKARELAAAIQRVQLPGDRLGVITFGSSPVVCAVPQTPLVWPETARPVDQDGSDLAAATAAGLALVPPGRQGSLVVLSDGNHTGPELDAVTRAARRAGLRIETQLLARAAGADAAIAEVAVPGQVGVGEPFAGSAIVIAEQAGPVHWRLVVDGEVVRQGDADLPAGRSVLQFRHALPAAGQHEIAVEIARVGDARPENDRGLAVVRAAAPPRVLCITPGGREDRLTRSLRAAGHDVLVVAPGRAPLSLAGLDAFRAVVLEDVAANELPPGGMQALARAVRDLGTGLLMTGGKASFGIGGYHKSPLEDVLPVTMEIREQQRRFGLAMAIALDRSGSMKAEIGGETKMQLADKGAASAVELLSPIDSLALIAVDTAAHVVAPMQPVDDRARLAGLARSIESSGGGIYIGSALHACAAELARAPQQNKHIVLFADADDAEEPDDYLTFVPALVKAGVTVSVIGLGTRANSGGALLEQIAQLGNGRCQFVADATDLPRVFAQETIQVARSSMVEAVTAVGIRPELALLGDMPTPFPSVGGYSLAWPRPRAEVGLITVDDQQAPLLAHWQVGLGRAAAFLGEADGPLSGELARWGSYGDCFGTLLRWLVGGQPPGLFVDGHREGGVGVYSIEVDGRDAAQLDTVRGVLSRPDGTTEDLVFERKEPGRLLVRVPLRGTGVHRAAVQVGGETIRMPPLCLPYSPEFAPAFDARAGERTLRSLARATGGEFGANVEAIVAGERRSTGGFDLGPPLAIALVVVLLLEITLRRWQVMLPVPAWLRRRQRVGPAVEAAATTAVTVVAQQEPGAPLGASAVKDGAPSEPSDGMLGALARAQKRTGR